METNVEPITLRKSLLLFGIPGLLLFAGLTYAIPFFQKLGCRDIFLFPFFLWLPILPLLPVSLLLFRKEKKGNPELQLAERFRLKAITGKDWLWISGGIVFVFISDFIVMEPVAKWMASQPLFAAPDHFPILFHPLKKIDFPLETFLGVSLPGNWLLLIVTIILHTTAMIAEEFMWRGYILPRQEANYGKYAWVINGLLWGYLVHFAMRWNFISFLPSMLVTPFIAQKTKNTWASLMVHGIPNTVVWILLLTGILGIG